MNSKLFSLRNILIVFVLIEIGVGILSYQFSQSIENKSLISRAATIAASLEHEDIIKFTGDERDLTNPIYNSIKNKFARIKEANADIRFVYLVGLKNNEIFFYVDNEPEDSEGYSPPGQIYTEASEEFKSIFSRGLPIIDGPTTDRWGNWVSGIAPVVDDETGGSIAAVGIDIQAQGYITRIIMSTLVPVLLLGLLLMLIAVAYMRHIQDQRLLQLKSRFVSIVSHDLHSPLRGIIWACQSLVKDTSSVLSESHKKTILLIEKASENLSTVVSNLLDFSRIERSKNLVVTYSQVKVKHLVSEVFDTMKLVALEKNTTLQSDDTVDSDIEIVCDKDKTKEALSNLVSNAIKYSEVGGIVNVSYKRESSSHILSVTNQGKGIPASERKNIFKEEFKATNIVHTSQDHGMGLHFTKLLVEAQKGEIWFQSVPDESTTFFIRLLVQPEK